MILYTNQNHVTLGTATYITSDGVLDVPDDIGQEILQCFANLYSTTPLTNDTKSGIIHTRRRSPSEIKESEVVLTEEPVVVSIEELVADPLPGDLENEEG